jgi:hypothetical protein
MIVRLDRHEIYQVAFAGIQRQTEALLLGRQHRHGFKGKGWDIHIEGAAAEYAFSKAAGWFWKSVAHDPKQLAGDVGKAQIRSTDRENGSLIVHKDDPNEATFVLVVGQIPEFNIAGWIIGKDAKQNEWWRTDTGRPAYFVPQDALKQLNL